MVYIYIYAYIEPIPAIPSHGVFGFWGKRRTAASLHGRWLSRIVSKLGVLMWCIVAKLEAKLHRKQNPRAPTTSVSKVVGVGLGGLTTF